MANHQPALLDALRAMGIEPNDAQKVIIEISMDAPAIVHIQSLADETLLGVVKAIDGEMHVVREALTEEATE